MRFVGLVRARENFRDVYTRCVIRMSRKTPDVHSDMLKLCVNGFRMQFLYNRLRIIFCIYVTILCIYNNRNTIFFFFFAIRTIEMLYIKNSCFNFDKSYFFSSSKCTIIILRTHSIFVKQLILIYYYLGTEESKLRRLKQIRYKFIE